ncbi:MAG: tetratricopeptide repeat protein [Armatimonadetes bacterium]|nr:tetratricopeptide repeat protein [Armatimonadota bacterium]
MNLTSTFVLGSAVAVAGWVGYTAFHRPMPSNTFEPIVHAPFDSNLIALQIKGCEAAVKADPRGALGFSLLASAYLNQSRESDDYATAVKAEVAARKSLELRKLGNQGAFNKLTSSLLQQHRFKEALAAANDAFKQVIFDDQTIRLQADCNIEIGNYAKAQLIIDANPRAFSTSPGMAIKAHLLDIYGSPVKAAQVLRSALYEAEQSPAIPGNALAWFHVRLAAQLAKNGNHDEARSEFHAALTLYPRDYKAMAGLAKLGFQGGHLKEAIDWGKKSDEIAPMADVRAVVGDAYFVSGDKANADQQYDMVTELTGRTHTHPLSGGTSFSQSTHGHPLDRQYAIFCADHAQDPIGALAAAKRDLADRKDIYAFDALAWVLHRNGKATEAKTSIERALATGSKDPVILYHASEIYRSIGDTAKAKKVRDLVLSIDPTVIKPEIGHSHTAKDK